MMLESAQSEKSEEFADEYTFFGGLPALNYIIYVYL